MKDINLLSLATVILLQIFGSFFHWWRMRSQKRVRGTFFDYLFSDSPSSTTAMFFVIVTGAWFSATTGTADLINPMMVYNALKDGVLSAKDIHIINALIGAITTGYAADSLLNKGSGK